MKIRLLVTFVAFVASTTVGCHFASRNPPSTHTLQVSMGDVLMQDVITQNVTVGVGNTLVVKLGSNYTTPYRWTPGMTIGDPAVIKQVGHEFMQPTSEAMGAPGAEVWTFTAEKPGKTTITTTYTSFVDNNTKPACTYTANVTVH